VQPRIKIDAKSGTTAGKDGNVFFEELVPQDTVFYVPVASMSKDTSIEAVRKSVPSHIQVGGDESLGRGWARVALLASDGGSK
jgi:CRISPR-associated protein Cmr4